MFEPPEPDPKDPRMPQVRSLTTGFRNFCLASILSQFWAMLVLEY